MLLADADLRRPVQHKVFQLTNDLGLSEVLDGGLSRSRSFSTRRWAWMFFRAEDCPMIRVFSLGLAR